MTSDKDYDLLIEMRKATRRSHNIANALILSKLVVVLTDTKLYGRALGSFHAVYSKLEQLLQQHKDVPGLSTVINVTSSIPRRAVAMEQDLQYLLGPDWRSQLPPSHAAQAYADHLQQLADQDPVLLLPYAFSLYIPILLGFLAQRIQRNLQLPDEQGLAFFTIPDKAKKLAQLRAAVTQAGHELPDPALRQRMVAEAIEQFRQNNAVVSEFSVGWRAVFHAVQMAAAAVPAWAVASMAAVGAASACAAAAAAGWWPAGVLEGR